MSLKDRVRAIVPAPLYGWLRTQRHRANIGRLYRRQAAAFVRHSAIDDRESQEQLAALLVFLGHRIEKGLSHSDFRPQFGRATLAQLGSYLSSWLGHGYPTDAFEPRIAVAALRAYWDRHQETGHSVPAEYPSGSPEIMALVNASDGGGSGAVEVRSEVPSDQSYPAVLRRRHSIREYAPGTPDVDDVLGAIEVAMSAPSVCNRQSQRVTVVSTADKVRAILDAQGGWRGYDYPPMLLVVTSSLASFVSSTERNEPYVDGGIFTMALLGALEWAGLAACPLNAMFEVGNERAVRKSAGISEGEALVCIVTVGNRPESVLCPRSVRKGAADVVRFA